MGRRKETITSPLARLMGGARLPAGGQLRLLPGGETLIKAGEAPDCLFFLRAGRLGVIRHEEGQAPRLLGVVRPGEPAGEMAMIAGTRHTATVVALRDSEVVSLPRDLFLKAAAGDAALMGELAHLMIRRARGAGGTTISEPSAFGLVSLSDSVAARPLAEALAAEIRAFGERAAVIGSEGLAHSVEWFTAVEADHDYVLYAAEAGEHAWKHLVGRQVDHLFRLGRAVEPPRPDAATYASEALREHRLVDLVLIQDPALKTPAGSAAWLDKAGVKRLFHLREGEPGEVKRLARVITGRSVGLVLSGGGARAYAHIGAIQALRDAGVPLDFLGGTSMGAIIAAGVALGWDDEELDQRIRKAFVEESPLDDIAFPMIAMTRGAKVRRLFEEHFGEVRIEDLWRPFFCVSSDLTEGAARVHRQGSVADALRASISLPGVLPPVVVDGHVLVDGAVTSNFPADLTRAQHYGPTIGVDVSVARGLDAKDIETPRLIPWLLSGGWRRGPPIVSVLMRSATVRSRGEMLSARGQTDLLIAPDAAHIEIRNWKAYEPAVEAGYRAAVAALAELEGPVINLRKAVRASMLSAAR